jgi:hypothetical protein
MKQIIRPYYFISRAKSVVNVFIGFQVQTCQVILAIDSNPIFLLNNKSIEHVEIYD